MALTREFKATVAARVQRDARFLEALFTEAINAYLSGETTTGKAMLRDLVNATVGLILTIITFPLILLTLGLFLFVVNAICIMLVAFIVPGLSINGFWPALVAALILSAVNMFWKMATAAPRTE